MQLSLNKNVFVQEKQDMFTKGVRYAKDIISSSTYFHSSDIQHHPLYDMAKDHTPVHKFVFELSWACRKGYGKLYGNTHMDMYKEELLKLYELGKDNSAKK